MSDVGEKIRRISRRVPVVHAIAYAGSYTKVLADRAPALTCAPPVRGVAQECEAACGWSPSVYFYAGSCYPFIVGIAVAYGNGKLDGAAGGMTPFDSGGVYRGYIAVDPEAVGYGSTTDFLRGQNRGLDAWQDAFAAHVETHFLDPLDYFDVRRGPSGSGPGRAFELNPRPWDPRLWSVELRSYAEVPFREDVQCWTCAGEEAIAFVEERRMAGDPAWEAFFCARIDSQFATEDPYHDFLGWIAAASGRDGG